MFQVAAPYALAKQYYTRFKLDLSFWAKNSISSKTFTTREYELDVLYKWNIKLENIGIIGKNDTEKYAMLDFFVTL